MGFTRCQQDGDRKTLSVGSKVEFDRETATRTARSLILIPPPCGLHCLRDYLEQDAAYAPQAPVAKTGPRRHRQLPQRLEPIREPIKDDVRRAKRQMADPYSKG
jgi:hypothetical protein